MLEERGISFYELPMIETTEGPDKGQLESTLRTQDFDWIVLTSPEAASAFADSWHAAGSPEVRVAVVGKGSNHPVLLQWLTPLMLQQTLLKLWTVCHFGRLLFVFV